MAPAAHGKKLSLTEEIGKLGDPRNILELYAGHRDLDKAPDDLMRLPNIEVLWLNDNFISKFKGLEHNVRLKHLYLHNNCMTTLVSASCCLPKLRHLETLQLAGNQLQDLKSTLGVLSQLHSLRKLCLHGNPLASEASYRPAVIYHVPSLEHLDVTSVTAIEREAAVKFFTAKRIEKRYAFGTVPKIWEKAALVKIGDPSEGELHLRKEVRANARRRADVAADAEAREITETNRPHFMLTYAARSTGLLSASAGAPEVASARFEFVARGRVPHLLVRMSFLSLTAAAKNAAAMLYGGDDLEGTKVHVAVTCLGVLPAPLLSRDVLVAQLDTDDESAHLRFEEFLFEGPAYCAAYDTIQQLAQVGKLDSAAITLTVRESSTMQPLAACRLPLLPLLQDKMQKTYSYDQQPLYASGGGAGAFAQSGTAVGKLTVDVVADWGLSNTSAGEFHNSASEFIRTRKGGRTVSSELKAPSRPSAHLARDFARLPPPAVAPPPLRDGASASEAELAAISRAAGDAAGAITLDAGAYAAFAKTKAVAKQPLQRGPRPREAHWL